MFQQLLKDVKHGRPHNKIKIKFKGIGNEANPDTVILSLHFVFYIMSYPFFAFYKIISFRMISLSAKSFSL
jgi:hypothetical protein